MTKIVYSQHTIGFFVLCLQFAMCLSMSDLVVIVCLRAKRGPLRILILFSLCAGVRKRTEWKNVNLPKRVEPQKSSRAN